MFADKANMRTLACILALVFSASAQQRSGASALALQVNPEATASPRMVTMQFTVSADGQSDVVSLTQVVSATVRAAAGQPVRFTATLTSWIGPVGPATPAALTWSGSATQSSGGARQASCAGGSFAATGPQPLSQGWAQSGSMQCQVTFQLAQPRSLIPGTYAATVSIDSGS